METGYNHKFKDVHDAIQHLLAWREEQWITHGDRTFRVGDMLREYDDMLLQRGVKRIKELFFLR